MDLMLEGKVAVVTGAGGGIGKDIASMLSKEGAVVMMADLNAESAEQAMAEIKTAGAKVSSVKVDATDEASVEKMIETCLSDFGRLDILVNNAGGGTAPEPVVKLSAEDWDRTIAVNLRSAFLCSRAAAGPMIEQKQGRIISIASISGKMGESLMGPYCAGKFGVIGLMQVMAKELARYGITVNSVCPGYVWTPGWDGLARDMGEKFSALSGQSPEEIFEKRVMEKVPLGRPQTGEDIAALVAFLASEKARNITGQAINVCGGAIMH